MNALLTDLYELNMVASYLRRGMNGMATFSLFVRRLPEQRGFLVAAGLGGCLDYLAQLRVGGGAPEYPGTEPKFPRKGPQAGKRLAFSGGGWAVSEGGAAF